MSTPEEAAAIRAAEQRLATAERQGAEADLRLLRFEVGRDLKLDPVISSRLVGATREELIADAEQLSAQVKAVRGTGAKDEPATMNDWIRNAAGRGGGGPTAKEQTEGDRIATVDGGARQPTAAAPDMNERIRNARDRALGQ